MYISRSAIIHLLTLALLMGSTIGSAACTVSTLPETNAAGLPAAQTVGSADVQVTLSAPQVTTSWDSRLPKPESLELPLLTLHRKRQATDPGERTLTVQLAGVVGGMPVELEIVSRHENPATGKQHRESSRFSLPERTCSASEPCTLYWTVEAATTLSDFYRLAVRDGDGVLLWENPNPEQPDVVALDTWEIGVEDYAVRVTYGVLFSFARGEKQFDQRLAPDAVHAFIADQFVPIVVETWQTQFGDWGFGPIHPDWDADKVVEVVFTCPPFALFDGTGTYTVSTYEDGSPYPERRIWLRSDEKVLERYDSLENGFKVIFAHEFFHLVQWNVRLAAGQTSTRWTNVFIEGQAIAASSVQYPELEMSRDHLASTKSQYSASAERFLERRLKTSYAALESEETQRYDAALYWRFLYEQFGDMSVLRVALEEMARRTADETAASLNEIMDAALGRLEGPFATYEQSLAAYAQANVALRLENGRCTSEDLSTCGGRYHDPHRMYTIPAWETMMNYRGSTLSHDGSIPASYGTDLIEVSLDGDLDGAPLTIFFHSEGARFSVEVWKLNMDEIGPRNPMRGLTGVHAVTPHPEALSGDCSDGCIYTISRLDLTQYSDLALIIVRVDPHESTDPSGAYHLVVDSGW